MKTEFHKNDAPILIVLGQSNAHGHGTQLAEDEKIFAPLKNVWGLSCKENQAFGLNDVTWSGFVTHDMNLGETQNHTCCLAEHFSRLWQQRIDSGENLPDLYVIQISVGAMGITEYEENGLNMWWPERPQKMKPGSLDHVDISLYPLTTQILSLTTKNLRKQGKTPRVIGLHWNQWETEAQTGGDAIRFAKENYETFFQGLRNAIGISCPIYLYRPLSDVYQNPEGVETLTNVFLDFVKSDREFYFIDLTKWERFDANRADKGIFLADLVHYSPNTHRYFAEFQFEQL